MIDPKQLMLLDDAIPPNIRASKPMIRKVARQLGIGYRISRRWYVTEEQVAQIIHHFLQKPTKPRLDAELHWRSERILSGLRRKL